MKKTHKLISNLSHHEKIVFNDTVARAANAYRHSILTLHKKPDLAARCVFKYGKTKTSGDLKTLFSTFENSNNLGDALKIHSRSKYDSAA